VLLLIRDIANPSNDDLSFPEFRHKDWYLGSSWASGITFPPYLNGKNQESSSEAIAAYEGVALFGQTMQQIFEGEKNERNAAISARISKVGRLLAGTELTSAKKYWHVTSKDDPQRIYPKSYTANCIGIMWSTLAQFGTWFGAARYLPYGIQLLPLTAISEARDDLEWVNTIYEPFTKSCAADFRCTTSGWSVLQLAIFATIGYKEEAAMRVGELPNDSFENAGGDGHSRTNTMWYIATRPDVQNPIPMLRYDVRGKEEVQPTPEYELNDCYLPKTCTSAALGRMAGEFTCGERIQYLIKEKEQTQWDGKHFLYFLLTVVRDVVVLMFESPSTCCLLQPVGGSADLNTKVFAGLVIQVFTTQVPRKRTKRKHMPTTSHPKKLQMLAWSVPVARKNNAIVI
jgi:hypothetical protein